jgi:PIN domain nuclease of toxin-antitoxin system
MAEETMEDCSSQSAFVEEDDDGEDFRKVLREANTAIVALTECISKEEKKLEQRYANSRKKIEEEENKLKLLHEQAKRKADEEIQRVAKEYEKLEQEKVILREKESISTTQLKEGITFLRSSSV